MDEPRKEPVLDMRINTLYSLEDVDSKYWLTKGNRVYNSVSKRYCAINITQGGYPYVTLLVKTPKWRKITMHKIIALARISNGPYKEIEHLNDIPYDLRVSNLRFSDRVTNSNRSFVNGKHHNPARKFEVTLLDGSIHKGCLKDLAKELNIPKATLYYRFYENSDVETLSEAYIKSHKVVVKSVRVIEEAPEQIRIGNKSIDYRKGNFGKDIIFDQDE